MNDKIFGNILCGCVDSLNAIRSEGGKPAILFHFELETSYFVENDHIRYITEFEVVVTITSNYKKVFYRIYDRDPEKCGEWIFTCDHDSCWRTDGFRFLWEHWIKDRNQLFDELKERKVETLKSINDVNIHVNFDRSIFHPFFKFVDVKIEKDPNDKFGYKRILKEVS